MLLKFDLQSFTIDTLIMEMRDLHKFTLAKLLHYLDTLKLWKYSKPRAARCILLGNLPTQFPLWGGGATLYKNSTNYG